MTIDDGYDSVASIAAPLLRAAGVPAVLFVPPGRIGHPGPPQPVLDASELRVLDGGGIELGVHGWDHQRLSGLPPAELRRQTLAARDALAEVTGRLPRAFAYPNGDFDDAAEEAVRRAGYDLAFAVDHHGGPFSIARIGVYSPDSVASLTLKAVLGARTFHRLKGLRRLLPR